MSDNPKQGERVTQRSILSKIQDGSATEEDFIAWEGRLTKKAVEEALRVMPNVVDHLTKQAFYLNNLSSEFYKKNPKLRGNRKLVQDIVMQTEGENPGDSYEQVLDKAAEKANKILEEKEKINPKGKEKKTLQDLDDQIGVL